MPATHPVAAGLPPRAATRRVGVEIPAANCKYGSLTNFSDCSFNSVKIWREIRKEREERGRGRERGRVSRLLRRCHGLHGDRLHADRLHGDGLHTDGFWHLHLITCFTVVPFLQHWFVSSGKKICVRTILLVGENRGRKKGGKDVCTCSGRTWLLLDKFRSLFQNCLTTHDYKLGWILVNCLGSFHLSSAGGARICISMYDEFSKNHSRNIDLERGGWWVLKEKIILSSRRLFLSFSILIINACSIHSYAFDETCVCVIWKNRLLYQECEITSNDTAILQNFNQKWKVFFIFARHSISRPVPVPSSLYPCSNRTSSNHLPSLSLWKKNGWNWTYWLSQKKKKNKQIISKFPPFPPP